MQKDLIWHMPKFHPRSSIWDNTEKRGRERARPTGSIEHPNVYSYRSGVGERGATCNYYNESARAHTQLAVSYRVSTYIKIFGINAAQARHQRLPAYFPNCLIRELINRF